MLEKFKYAYENMKRKEENKFIDNKSIYEQKS